MTPPLVSAIIPVYNGAQYVGQAIESALAQRDVAVEVIAVDDGSTDHTWNVLTAFGNRIACVQQRNSGPARARNRGAGLARGAWLAFLDADDIWLPDKLAKQLSLAETDIGLVYTDRLNVGHSDRVSMKQSEAVPQFEGDVLEPLLMDNFISLSSVLMRTEVFRQLGGFDESLAGTEDWDLWLRYAANRRVRLCAEPLTLRRWRPESLSSRVQHMRDQRLRALRRAFATPRGTNIPRTVRARALSACWQTSAWSAASTRPILALAWYWRAVCYWPVSTAAYKGMVKCLLGRA